MIFENKIIYIISYEGWGDMLMSKHHYAIELSKKGNTVYFINKPDFNRRLRRGEIEITTTEYKSLFSVTTRLIHPFIWKYRYRTLNDILIKRQLRRIIKKIGVRPDIVWSFDGNNIFPLKSFGKAALKIFMPVDGPFGVKEELLSTQDANIIVSVTENILERYKTIPLPKCRINHGVSDVFINREISEELNKPLRIGYSGSLIRSDLDTEVFSKIIQHHRDKIFEFWGENDPSNSNIHLAPDVDPKTFSFIQFLKTSPNVIMHGAVKPHILAQGLKRMDAFLIAYNIKDDHNNHHKVLEYLGTGKVVISSYMACYAVHTKLIEMVKTVDCNHGLPDLLDSVLTNIRSFNSTENQLSRIAFARNNTYSHQLERLEIAMSEILYQKSFL